MSNPNLYASSQSFVPGSGPNPAGINPAMLAAGFPNGPVGPQQQHKFPPNAFGSGAVNPAQLMGGGAAGGGAGINMAMAINPMSGGLNPAQLLQQQQQQQQQHHGMTNGTMGGMNMNMNMNMMNMNPGMGVTGMSGIGGGPPPGGINPAALSQSENSGFNPMAQAQHPSHGQHNQPQMVQRQSAQPPLTPQQQMMLSALGMTREQFFSLTQAERQTAWMRLLTQMQGPSNTNLGPNPTSTVGGPHHLQQQQHQQQQHMMPPPAPPQSQGGPISVPGRPPTSQAPPSAPGQPNHQQRPPTAQGHQQRPPTAQGQHQLPQQHRPPTAQGNHRPPTAQGMQRPPTAQGHRVASGPGPGSQPQTPNTTAATLAMGMAQAQARPPTAQDQRPGGQQTRPSTAQGMPQTPTNANTPGTRPPTAQSGIGQQISRPGTALSHRSPVSANGSASAQSPGARPPSRLGEQAYAMNGYPKVSSAQQGMQLSQQSQPNPYPSTPQQQQQQQQSPFSQKAQGQVFLQMNHPITPQNSAMMQQHQAQANMLAQTSQQQQFMQNAGGGPSPAFGGFPSGQPNMGMQGSPPMPGSPYRGAKRKMDSPHMTTPMGPPSMPNRSSSMSGSGDFGVAGMNGIPGGGGGGVPNSVHHHQGANSQSPRPPSSSDMMNINFGVPTNLGGPQTPQRPGNMMGGGGGSGGGSGTPGLSGQQQSVVGGPPGTPMNLAQLQLQQHQQQQQQQLQHQHQQQQQQARQASLPPGQSPMQKEPSLGGGGGPMGSMGMGMRASVPPAVPGPNVPGPVARAPSTVAGTPVPPGSSASAAGPAVTADGSVQGSSSSSSSSSSAAAAALAAQLPPLPVNVTLNPAVTVVTPVPLIDSLKHIPPISDDEIQEIQGWMKKDKEYEVVLRKTKERMAGEMRGLFGGAAWWEKGAPDVDVHRWKRGREGFDVRYPLRRGKEKEGRERRKRQREGLRLPRKLDSEEADRPEQLVPIRLEFDVEHHKMRDTFVWNLNDPVVTPETFAQSIVDDYALAPSYHSVIVKSIQEQLSDFKAHSLHYDADSGELLVDLTSEIPVQQGVLDDSQDRWWQLWRKKVKVDGGASVGSGVGGAASRRSKKKRKMVVNSGGSNAVATTTTTTTAVATAVASVPVVKVEEEEEKEKMVVLDVSMSSASMDLDDFGKPMAIDEIKLDEELMHEEMRILVRLDIIVGSMKLEDQLEWDLENDSVAPEEFAEVYAQDLGLGGEFKTAIAHSIREQIQMYQKSLFLVGHPSDGSPIQDEELRQAFLPSIATGARPMDQVQAYTPLLNAVSDSDIERSEKEREKEMNKRRKRNQRGRRGIVIPDREPVRTYRTPAIGFPELDPATLALAAAANASGSRRAAAAAASLTIANMVASENGTAFIPAPTPIAAVQAPPPKEKKPKGLFKAPSLPGSVLKARAQIVAPTPSTAADVTKLPAPLENDPPPAIPPPPPPPEPKIMKFVPKKSAKELEREAKEKEFVDGQHPNFIDGVWHCSNCGCPESIAIGRRKGPLGDKSQCGTCGKFWHRHRRPRPVEYNADPEYHRRKEGDTKTPAKKKASAATLRAQGGGGGTAATSTPAADVSEPPTPAKNGDVDVGSRRSPSPMKDDDDRAISPVSTASSASEPPLAQKVKLNGANHAKSGTPRASAGGGGAGGKEGKPSSKPSHSATPKEKLETPLSLKEKEKPATPRVKSENGQEASPGGASVHAPSSTSDSVATTNLVPQQIPSWLTGAVQGMRAKYPDDKFEAILRRTAGSPPDWRIRCLDCPGKLYTPGPGESLSNYEVHLRNRLHRQRVNERLNVSSPQRSS